MKGGWGGGHCRGIFEDTWVVLMYVLTYLYYLCRFESSIVRSFYVEYPFRLDPPQNKQYIKKQVFLLSL
jgi:hypothetical protein